MIETTWTRVASDGRRRVIPSNAWRWHIQEREIRSIAHRGTVATREFQSRRAARLMAAFRPDCNECGDVPLAGSGLFCHVCGQGDRTNLHGLRVMGRPLAAVA